MTPLTLLDTELELAGGVLRTHEHRALRMQLSRAVTSGRLLRPLPGVVADPQVAATLLGKLVIAHAWLPDGVFMGRCAAYLWWGDQLQFDEVQMIGRCDQTHKAIHCRRRKVPPEHIHTRAGLRLTSPALTVLDCLAMGDCDVLYAALRSRRVTIKLLRQTLKQLPGRRKNKTIAAELRRARANPWSGGEADLHDFLREHGFFRWKGNSRIATEEGIFYGDVVFERERLIIELDGFEYHSSPADLERDRERQAALLAQGYRVLRVTVRMLMTHPDRLERQIREALKIRKSTTILGAA